jgi:5-hydroxyisourate hydrolase-like protein (transthyretin family)
MVITRKKIIVAGISLILLLGFIYVYKQLKDFNESFNRFCDKGFGETPFRLHILDKNTQRPIDSVRIQLRYGASMDKRLDTTLIQNNGVTYNFFIPKEDECEPYWLEISNRLYWQSIHVPIKKGALNDTTVSVTPATQIKVKLHSQLISKFSDTLFVYFKAPDNTVEEWDYFTAVDFRKYKTRVRFYSLKSNMHYKVMWVHKSAPSIDTTYSEFYTSPLDTLVLKYK